MYKHLFVCLFAVVASFSMAQPVADKIGKISGKVLDSTGTKGIPSASVYVFRVMYDSARHVEKELLVGTSITQPNGAFVIEHLPLNKKLLIQVSMVGYDTYTSKSFSLNTIKAEQVLSDISLVPNPTNLQDVVVTTTTKQFFEMGVDRKIFNVDNNIISAGQTAQEVMKQIPSVNVDVDGNVLVRNAAPQIFIDGRPTTLTLEQIPADIIDKVELITNPGAKFDASGGGSGILNIVLKKNKKLGYNGGVMVGADTRGGYNGGFDFSIREGKFNVFTRAMLRNRAGKTLSINERDNRNDTIIRQETNSQNGGAFKFLNLGTDYFLDDNNTFTLAGNYVNGQFNNTNPLLVDSLFQSHPFAYNTVQSLTNHEFTNYGIQFSYRHNFDTVAHFLSLDASYNNAVANNSSNIHTGTFLDEARTIRKPNAKNVLQNNNGEGGNKRATVQLDYENAIFKNKKIELGVRSDFSIFNSQNLQYVDSTGQGTGYYIFQPTVSTKYNFEDQVFAAYANYSAKWGEQLSYQLGIRAERSNYNAVNNGFTKSGQDTITRFAIKYPISLFPSAFLTYKLSMKEDIQVNYSRRINRPNFFQLLPTPDLSNPYNVQVGNPNLKPEFTDVYEISYNKTYGLRGNLLASAYLKQGHNLIISYQYFDKNISPSPITTYLNASNSTTYGLELTNKFNPLKFWELTINLNFYHTKIVSDLGNKTSANERFSWFGKINNSIKLPNNFSLQLSADYQAKSVLPISNDNRRFGGPGNSNLGTVQGFIYPVFDLDAAIKKDWKFKGNNTLSVSLSISDAFATNVKKSYAETPYMIQTSSRLRQPQTVRLNLSYRFGKMDVSIFKRKSKGISDDNRGSMGDE